MHHRAPHNSGPNAPCLDSASTLQVVAKAVQQVMKKRDIQHFGRVLEFLDLLHEQVPDLLYYRHYAKLSLGVKGKMVLDMVEKRRSLLDILKALNRHFPAVYPPDPRATPRDLFKVNQCNTHFRRLVLRMIRDEKFRKNYVERELPNDYGEKFMAALEKLLVELLQRLHAVLTHQVSESVDKTAHTETSRIEKDNASMCPAPKALRENCLQHQDDPHALNTPNLISEDPTVMENLSCSKNASAERGHQLMVEIRQNSAEHRSCLKGSRKRKGSNVSKQTPCSEKAVTAERRLYTDFPIYDSEYRGDYSLHRSRPVFDIFGLDCSEDTDVDRFTSHSPPNPLQSQETDTILEKHPTQTLVREMRVCERAPQGLQPKSNALTSPAVAHVSKTTHRTDNETAASVPQCKVGSVAQDVPKVNPHGERYLDRRNPRTDNVGSSEVSVPEVRHPMSWKYQPVVRLTKLPMDIINAQNRCHDFTEPVESEEDSQDTSWTDTETWPETCSVSTDNLTSDPDYYPGFY